MDFVQLLQTPLYVAFNPSYLKRCFEKTGLYPLDPSKHRHLVCNPLSDEYQTLVQEKIDQILSIPTPENKVKVKKKYLTTHGKFLTAEVVQ